MNGDLQGKAFLINACVYSVVALLNQQPISLSSMIYKPGQGDADQDGFSKLDTGVVEYVNGSSVYGKLGALNELQLIGEQFVSTGSPKFTIAVDPNLLPVQTSTVYLYIYYNTVVATNGVGQRVGVTVTTANQAAKRLLAL